jgi:nucleoside-diphosphate-sugar epimerase
MNVKSKKIALIGGAGFIGHNMAISLKKRGHEPIIIDSLAVNNMLSFTDNEIKNRKMYWSILNQRMDLLHENDIQINIEDARDYNALSMLLGQLQPDVIVQLAAVSHANKSNKDPHTTFDHTLRTLENALDYSIDGKAKKAPHFIYFSSSMVYGHFEGKHVTEETPCNPLGIYGTLKYSGELIVKAYSRVFDLPYTIIRPSALYGERCVSRRVSQIFIENAVQGLDITINGNGKDLLDFTYIDDLIQGTTLAIEKEEARYETFNLTYGEARSIGEMAEIMKDHFDGIKINYIPKDNLTPDRGTLNVDKARNLLGYNPQNSIKDGYPKYIQWYKEFWDSMKK